MGFAIPSAFGSGADMRVPARHRIFERGNAAIEGRPDLMIRRKLMTPYNGIRVYKVDPCSGVEGRPPHVSVSSASFRPRRTVSAATPVAAATNRNPARTQLRGLRAQPQPSRKLAQMRTYHREPPRQ